MLRYLKVFLALLVLVGGLLALFATLLWNGYMLQIPSEKDLSHLDLPQATEIYTSDSILLGKMYVENRKSISYQELPQQLVNCLLSTEDVRFYEHNGVDVQGLMRVGFKTLLLDKKSGGGSTLTQQLIKNLFPRGSYDTDLLVVHKIREWIAAIKMERIYSKEEIIELYLNTVPFGHNTFGISTAASYYFGKEVADLEIQEMATLIGLLKGTSLYDPERDREACTARRNVVLTNMLKEGHLSERDLQISLESKIVLAADSPRAPRIAPFFTQHVMATVKELIRLENVYENSNIDPYTDGLKIYTTLDSRLQEMAENSLKDHMIKLQDQFNKEWTAARWKEEQSTLVKLLRMKQYAGYENICDKLQREKPLTQREDSALEEMKSDLIRLHAGFTFIKNSGEVLAWVGGRDFNYSQYDNVKGSRQVGSVFKPIVYVTAVDQGVNLCNYFKNEKKTYNRFDDWEPRNASGRYTGEYTMKGALTWSLNVISVQVLLRAGLLDVLNVARQMGITNNIPEVPSISLGTPDISLFEMVNAYTCFPNEGKRVPTKYIESILLPDGKDLLSRQRQDVKEVFSPKVAAIMTHMLESVVNIGTAQSIRSEYQLGGPIAGKTGTTQNQSDGWFVGYTPMFTAGAWIGADSPAIHFESLTEGAGAKTALPIWANFVSTLSQHPDYAYLFEGEFTPAKGRALRCLNQAMYRDSPEELNKD